MRPWPAFVLALLAAAVPFVQQRIDARQDRWREQREVLYVADGAALRRLLPGFEILAADLYWLRTVQYYGSKVAFGGGSAMPLLYPLADVTTTLDPRLEIAYRYGAIFLCEAPPRGQGDCRAGLRLLRKGTRTLSSTWGLYQDLGYFRFFYLGDAEGASRDLLEAARRPGAPPTLTTLAAALLQKSGRNAAARQIWRALHDQYPEGLMRENAAYNLQRLDALDALEQLGLVVGRASEAGLPRPTTTGQLARLGVDRRLLADPTGVPFEWDERRGGFWFSPRSSLWRPN